ncbi:class I SAM-dependent methyltransferase [Sporichthya brevicatena]|uniref:Class I SAM-dependent methyltransferase n=1 Tax=Sporichthya brevicatena TaxID=171442 RepID=A0ABP3SBK6_9ACTN
MTDDATPAPLPVTLQGVPETTLWTLYHRARDAARPKALLHDPKAAELVAAIDFPFEQRFGGRTTGMEGYLGERALTFDREVLGVLATDPDAVVVALGEGLETQFWRVDNGRVRWFTVDLPETAEVRRKLVGEDPPRRRLFAGSALEEAWYAALTADGVVGPTDRVVVVAQGLLMYLPPPEVDALIVRCAERFRRGVFLFDTVPVWFSWLSRRGLIRAPNGYRAPAMPHGLNAGDHERIRRLSPDIASVRSVAPAGGPGLMTKVLLPLGRSFPVIRRGMPEVVRIDFTP